MVAFFRRIAESAWFQHFITGVILLAGALVGLETSRAIRAAIPSVLHTLDTIVLWIFALEVVIKMGAEGSKPWRYFKDGWNCFDFAIVAVCFMPFTGQAVVVLRLLRLLRVLKLVRALPKLQILVSALLKSIPSMAYVSLLLMMLFYVYAVAAVFLFGTNDPMHFGDLPTAMLSLFRVVTLEDWTDVMYINMFGCDRYGYGPDSLVPCTAPEANPVLAALFFVSFVLIGTMIVLNLFIGVIMSGMEEAGADARELEDADRRAAGTLPTVSDELEEVERRLHEIQEALQHVHERVSRHRKNATLPSPSSAE